MAELQHQWTEFNPFQAVGTQTWTWPVGERLHYWGYSVRPFQFNMEAELVRHFTTTDNNGLWTENLVVTTNTGGLIRFSAIAVIGA